jgi:hypothetical protein
MKKPSCFLGVGTGVAQEVTSRRSPKSPVAFENFMNLPLFEFADRL